MLQIAEGTIIRGTLRSFDIATAILDWLLEKCADIHTRCCANIANRYDQAWCEFTDKHLTWDTVEEHKLVEFLMAEMDDLAPDSMYFGTAEGDGSDFGFWRNPSEFEDWPCDGCDMYIYDGACVGCTESDADNMEGGIIDA